MVSYHIPVQMQVFALFDRATRNDTHCSETVRNTHGCRNVSERAALPNSAGGLGRPRRRLSEIVRTSRLRPPIGDLGASNFRHT